ncbi:MAG: dipeptidase [Parasphingorhabdus sp.]|uniref:dipeptidase n=1 Tax=Parasphingorhabdus sp. TaxID=2709688 RepID=UPI003299E021
MKSKLLPLTIATISLITGSPAAFAQSAEVMAQEVLDSHPIIDGHNDVPEQIRGRFDADFSQFDFRDTLDTLGTAEKPMHTDIARLRKGGIGGQFWSVWIDPELPRAEAVERVIQQIDVVHRLVNQYRDLEIALTADDIERAAKSGRIASLIGMEGGHSIGNSLAVLRQTYALGARYMTLTHWKTLDWADAATDAPKSDGLSEFGVRVVHEMNAMGMMVDISHVSPATMHDTLDVARAPVIFSHSSASGVAEHPRNVPDSVLKRLPDNGGVVMVTFVPSYLKAERRDWEAAEKAEDARAKSLFPGEERRRDAHMANWRQSNPMPAVTASDVADHIDHVRNIAGIDNIGIGGDYDGIKFLPDDMKDVATYPVLFTELARRGYSKDDLAKISRGNILRVMRAAERVAGHHKMDVK